jgi:hypothetical protein
MWLSIHHLLAGGVMSNPQWKRTERRIAALLGGTRVPISGRQRGDQPDIAHADFSIEVKHRATIPAWLTDAMHQSEAAAGADQLPIVIIHEHGKPYADALVVLKLSQFVERHIPTAREEVNPCP